MDYEAGYEMRRPEHPKALWVIIWVPLGNFLAYKMGTISPALHPS